MKYPIITKKEFCEYIKILKSMDRKELHISKLLERVAEGPSWIFVYNDEKTAIMSLLAKLMGVEDNDLGNDLEYFCYDLNFGKEYVKGCITVDGVDIDVSTPSKLYDYLVADYLKRNPEDKQGD